MAQRRNFFPVRKLGTEPRIEITSECGQIEPCALQQLGGPPIILVQQAVKHVFWLHHWRLITRRPAARCFQGASTGGGEVVEHRHDHSEKSGAAEFWRFRFSVFYWRERSRIRDTGARQADRAPKLRLPL